MFVSIKWYFQGHILCNECSSALATCVTCGEEVSTRSEEAERHAETLRMMVEGIGEDSEEKDDLEIVDISPACEETIFGCEEDLSIHVTGTQELAGSGWARVMGGLAFR